MTEPERRNSSNEGGRDLDLRLRRLAVLAEPVRRRLYLYVCDQAREVTRDEAAAALKLSRPLVAFHLDKLVSHGLLDVNFRRLTDRQGPGAGRPSKLYRPSTQDVELSLPPRRYGLLGVLLVRALRRSGEDVAAELRAESEQAGLELGRRARRQGHRESTIDESISLVLDSQGYEPVIDADGLIRCRNCPFRAVMTEDRDLICGMNLALMRGVLTGLKTSPERAQLDPSCGGCCVVFHPDPLEMGACA
ncbi:MAG TPA: helix-turn-helix domain-containing protein [Chloroflexota bacterium]|nr:helix-turn-helix domain-containing protein [Chloroflexota bacterium]